MVKNSRQLWNKPLKHIYRYFEKWAEQTPDATAVTFEGQATSYRELSRRVDRLAHYLWDQGVGIGTPVAMSVERTTDMVVGLLGIFKAGGIYVPIDPAYPEKRKKEMLRETKPALLLARANPEEEMLAGHSVRTNIKSNDKIATYLESNGQDPSPGPAHLSHIIFTSGSSGTPKGVMVPHDSLSHNILSLQERLGIEPKDKYLHTASISFTSSLRQFFLPLTQGAIIVVAETLCHYAPASFLEMIQRHEVTILDIVPSFWARCIDFLETLEKRERNRLCDNRLRMILSSSAELPGHIPNGIPLSLNKNLKLFNMYGQTETLGNVAIYSIPPSKPIECNVPIGPAIYGNRIRLLDQHLNPIQDNSPGEIVVSGTSLASGYLNHPSMTDNHFIPNPLGDADHRVLYRTGDMGRIEPDGTILYTGRRDFQINLNGFRLEPGDVEHAIKQHPAIRSAVVILQAYSPGNEALVAFFTLRKKSKPNAAELRLFLAKRIPDFMIPSRFICLSSIPRLLNGKIDRQRLVAIRTDEHLYRTQPSPPRSIAEKVLVQICSDVLHLEQAGTHDNFFDLGGTSLLAIQAVSKLEKQTGIRIDPRELIYQTIGQIAATIDNDEVSSRHSRRKADPVDAFFFGAPDKQLYGYLHYASHCRSNDYGVVLCYPAFFEYGQFHRAYRRLAVGLSRAGFPVLRFDYYGTGDSAGECMEARFHIWTENVAQAVDILKYKSRCKKILLVGMSIGGSLAMAAAEAMGGVDRLILWDPALSGHSYINALKKSHERMLLNSLVVQSGKKVNGKFSEAWGYAIHNSLIDEIRALNLLSLREPPARKCLIIETNPEVTLAALENHLTSQQVKAERIILHSPEIWSWIKDSQNVVVPHRMIQKAIEWQVKGGL